MTYIGRVKQGVVVFDGPTRPPEGAEVRIEEVTAESGPTWGEVFKGVIGAAEGLPPDMAENHDHYIHGSPKK